MTISLLGNKLAAANIMCAAAVFPAHALKVKAGQILTLYHQLQGGQNSVTGVLP